MGPSKRWLKKHSGVSKRHLAFYTKPFQFVHNHHYYSLSGRFVAMLAIIPDRFEGRIT